MARHTRAVAADTRTERYDDAERERFDDDDTPPLRLILAPYTMIDVYARYAVD